MFKYMKKFNWERLVDVAIFVIATAVGILIFATTFVIAKAIIEAVF
jgi:hypothetical protein